MIFKRSFLDKNSTISLGVILGVLSLYLLFDTKYEINRVEDFALGAETTSVFGRVDEQFVHCSDLNDIKNCLISYRAKGGASAVILWLGNSQLHAVNQYSEGQETSAQMLHKKFQNRNRYVLTASQPNANLQEHYLFFSHLVHQLPVATLVLPIVFDDMREDGVRLSLRGALKDESTMQLLNQNLVGKGIVTNVEKSGSDSDDAGLDDTFQKKVERFLNDKLGSSWALWAERPRFRGEILGNLYLLRNWTFGINAQSIRKMIPGRYKKNRDSFVEILNLAKQKNINVLVYVAPIRNDVKIPYIHKEYENFKKEMSLLTSSADAKFINLEDLVPARFWGTKASTSSFGGYELDFMHFQAAGHKLLTDALFNELNALNLDLGEVK